MKKFNIDEFNRLTYMKALERNAKAGKPLSGFQFIYAERKQDEHFPCQHIHLTLKGWDK
jgi:hypothetical protein